MLFIGEDLDVLLELCDRIMVLCHGAVTGILDGTERHQRANGPPHGRRNMQKGGRRPMSKPTPSSLVTRRSSPEPLLRVVKKPELPPWQASLLRVGAGPGRGRLFILPSGAKPAERLCRDDPRLLPQQNCHSVHGENRTFHDPAGTSLGVTPAFKMRFWNIGAEGQLIMGAVFATYFALFHSDGRTFCCCCLSSWPV